MQTTVLNHKDLLLLLSFILMVGALVFSGISYKVYAANKGKKTLNAIRSTNKRRISNKDGSVNLTKINNDVWVHTTYTKMDGHSVPANGLLIRSSKGLYLVDATWNDKLAKELVKLIKQNFHQKVKGAIITHHKIDRVGGIRALMKANIPVESTSLVAKMTKAAGYPAPKPSLDNQPVLKLGKTIVETYYPGEAHTKDNMTVWLPQYKILFGDMFFALEQRNVGIIDEANMEAWPYTIQNLMNKYPDARMVIPGHYNWGDFSLLSHSIDNLKTYQSSKQMDFSQYEKDII
ncbi:subclass B1 metallo-beta-lactamase [Heyndrickxia shackletonii]|uniref:subclass B1 metallo-beta-lactamase n=1 Tax=Heyndrickxia shackletonii TaxID=157838 RepID=UPI0006EC1741|nr:subclass B1 metallo-beta-lactamase [Heyndrickxia shackletonii]NEY98767.1 subclass B1 metallo-beta-lactamase [Heyndrickxia shackletonii]